MPELAEVALFAQDLNRATHGQALKKISFPNRRDWGSVIVPNRLMKSLILLCGKKLEFSSQGKSLFVSEIGASPIVSIQLGMTGQFHLSLLEGKWARHYFMCLHFDDLSIHYADPRRFGRVQLPSPMPCSIGGYSNKHGFHTIKTPLLPRGYMSQPRISWLLSTGDQTGVGNYMANEALGRLNLSPYEPCRSEAEALLLLRKCTQIASSSFRNGGNSFGSGYFRLSGSEGKYLKRCKFYQNQKVRRVVFRRRPVFSKFSPEKTKE